MEKVCASQNRGPDPLSCSEAQDLLADIMNILAARLIPYCWKLIGDDADSLHRLLDITRDDMDDILRLCNLFGPNDQRLKMKNLKFLP